MSESGIFKQAVQLPPEERAAYLDAACGPNHQLRQEVESLLRAHEQAHSFLQQPAAVQAIDVTAAYRPITEGPGTCIGPYKLLQQIGEGGFGVVYMAEQLEPVRRKVALKIIKPGMDTKEVIARFESERQALALMDHPNIARVFDAGATDSRRPYFVMELVKGVPMTEYCDKNNLSTEGRLRLFITVCQAVQHAHQKGVIHRDIKPTNIMVTLHDGMPVPKVIDFGVAKATSQQLTQRTLFTSYGQMIGTPAYMSPEQAEMSGLDIDTRSDIYSLGVLLYEILTGSTPFDARRLLTAGYAEMQRIIREEEPPWPSTRLSTRGDSAIISSHRSTDPKRLTQLLRGDLDVIVMKALEKDRNRRYDTPSTFAADIQRFLQREPVLARAPSTIYRLKKFTQRNRRTAIVAVVLTSLMLLVLINHFVGHFRLKEARGRAYAESNKARIAEAEALDRLAEMTRQKERAEKAERQAQVERDRAQAMALEQVKLTRNAANALIEANEQRDRALAAEQDSKEQRDRAQAERDITRAVTNFLEQDLVGRANPGVHGPLFDPNLRFLDFLRLLGGPSLDQQFRDQPLVEAALRQLVGQLHRAFGEYALAESYLQKCLEIRRRELGNAHADTLHAMNNLAALYEEQRQFDKAEPLLVAALEGRRQLLTDKHPDTLSSMNNLAAIYHAQQQFAKAEPLYIETLQLRRAVLGDQHASTFGSLSNLYNLYWDQGQPEKFDPIWKEMTESHFNNLGDADPQTIDWLLNPAKMFMNRGQYERAEAIYSRVLDWQRRKLGEDDPRTLQSMHDLAFIFQQRGRMAEALPLATEAVRRRTAVLGSDDPQTLFSQNNLAWVYRSTGRLTEAIRLHEMVLQGLKTKLGPDHYETLVAMNNLADMYQAANRIPEALQLRDAALRQQRTRSPEQADTLNWMHNLAVTYLEHGFPEKSEPLYRELLALHRKRGANSLDLAAAQARLGQSLLDQKKYAEAEPFLRESLAIREQKIPDHWFTWNTKSQLGGSLLGYARELRESDPSAAEKEFAAAEPLLVAGYEGLKKRERAITVPMRMPEALERLIQLYESWNRTDKAATWRAEREQVFGGFIQDWIVLSAPLPFPDQMADSALQLQQIPNEAGLKPREGDLVGTVIGVDSAAADRIQWTRHRANQFFVDFTALYPAQRTHEAVTYAVCYVNCDTERKDLVLTVGSDDQAKIYLNGTEVLSCPKPRRLIRDQDQVANITLTPGLNVLVFKVVNQTGGWQGCIRFTDGNGRPAQGLRMDSTRN